MNIKNYMYINYMFYIYLKRCLIYVKKVEINLESKPH